MTIHLNNAEFIWQADFPGGDFLAAIEAVEDEPGFKIQYRFRYHKDDEVWDSKDIKKWYAFQLPFALDEAVSQADGVFSRIPFPGGINKLDLRGKTDEEKHDLLITQKFAHVKHFDKDGKELRDH